MTCESDTLRRQRHGFVFISLNRMTPQEFVSLFETPLKKARLWSMVRSMLSMYKYPEQRAEIVKDKFDGRTLGGLQSAQLETALDVLSVVLDKKPMCIVSESGLRFFTGRRRLPAKVGNIST